LAKVTPPPSRPKNIQVWALAVPNEVTIPMAATAKTARAVL
jgi:hypothetical protein